MSSSAIGVIGGSGLYEIDGLSSIERISVDTPYGCPSDDIVAARAGENKIFFIPRHGVGHRLLPHEINYRANIWALKKLGVTAVLSVSAVGSMQQAIHPGHLVFPDQLIDRTLGRQRTFFGDGVAGHVMFADPYCDVFRKKVYDLANRAGAQCHFGGTYVCIDGPQFSTRAESNWFRTLDVSVIGMTASPEARLAREFEMCYATLALSTDYDCWNEEEGDVSVEQVIGVMKKNVGMSKNIIKLLAENAHFTCTSKCCEAGRYAIMTDEKVIPVEAKRRLQLVYGKYWNQS